jgi:hypothetical protein
MFCDCTSLVTAPELPATKLAEECYSFMFYDCYSLTTAPKLPATTLAYKCYEYMFDGCNKLTTAPALPATTLMQECYSHMFEGCTALTAAPELPATKLAYHCYYYMFSGTNILPDCSNIDFANNTVVGSGGLAGLFANTKLTDADLGRILPKNNEGKYCLPVTTSGHSCYRQMFYGCNKLTTAPEIYATASAMCCCEGMFAGCTSLVNAPSALYATTLADNCYKSMFSGCHSLVTAPELHATTLAGECYSHMFDSCNKLTSAPELPVTTLAYKCYEYMFYKCTSLTSAPELPATTLQNWCYDHMFYGCAGLTTAPLLPAATLTQECYQYMFYECINLNNITMLATDISANYCLNTWTRQVSSTGTFTKHRDMKSLLTGTSGIPVGWEVKDNITLTECTSLIITADDVVGNATTTTIHYTATCNGVDSYGETVTGLIEEGTAVSATFPQNTSETETIERTITFEFMGVTANTVITQGVWIPQSYTIDLNNQWELTTAISNPDSTLYDGVYQSFSNKGVNNSAALMYIDIVGYSSFKFYVRSNAESTYDFVVVSNLDSTLTNGTTSGSAVKMTTSGKQQSGTSINSYTLVEFTGIDMGAHRITVMYRKDSSSNSGDDRGYVLIPKTQ